MQHLDEFKDKFSNVIWHIPSTKEMSLKSEVESKSVVPVKICTAHAHFYVVIKS